MKNEKLFRVLDQFRGNQSIEEYGKLTMGVSALSIILGYESLNYFVQQYDEMKIFKTQILESISEDTEKKEIIYYVFSSCLIKFRDTLGFKIIFEALMNENMEEIFEDAISILDSFDPVGAAESLNQLVIELLKDVPGETLVDYCSGRGNMISMCFKEKIAAQYYGQEMDETNYYISKIRFYLNGEKNTCLEKGDVLRDLKFLDESGNQKKFDKAFSKFPLGLNNSWKLSNQVLSFWKDSEVSSKTMNHLDWGYIGLLASSIKKNGKAIVVIRSSILSNVIDREYRKELIKQHMIEGIIKLPRFILPYVGVELSLIILSHENISVRMVDASELYAKKRRINELADENISEIYNLYTVNKDTKGAKTITEKELIDSDYLLEPFNYLVLNQLKIQCPVKLEQVTERLFRGNQFKADDLDRLITEESVYQIVSLKDIENGIISTDLTPVLITDEKKYARYFLEDGDLLMTAKGTVLKTAVVKLKNNEKLIATGNIMVVRLSKEKVNPFYLKVFLDSTIGRLILKSVQTGTSLISISTGALKEMLISVPSMDKQKKMAGLYLEKLEMYLETQVRLRDLENEIANLYEEME
ncbi:MAG: N-6 DNA methylase [Acetobacterium sp.]